MFEHIQGFSFDTGVYSTIYGTIIINIVYSDFDT